MIVVNLGWSNSVNNEKCGVVDPGDLGSDSFLVLVSNGDSGSLDIRVSKNLQY